jgi:SDR family mycofactocin-dependent oxidoreductase
MTGVQRVRLEGRVALVTGAARGQGRSHALALAREGACVALADVCHDLPSIPYPLASEEQLEQAARAVRDQGGEAIALQCDVSKSTDVARTVDATIERFGKIDILVANASVNATSPCLDICEEQWDMMIDVNLKGVWLCCKYAAPHMIDRGYGKIVITSSILGVKVQTNLAHYIASKHGVIGLTRALALELSPHNINVNTIMPGMINTDMTRYLSAPIAESLGLSGEQFYTQFVNDYHAFHGDRGEIVPQDISDAVLFLASDESRQITGHALAVDAGMLVAR